VQEIPGDQWMSQGEPHAQGDHFATDRAVLRFDGHHPFDACLVEQVIDQRARAVAMTKRDEGLAFEIREADLRPLGQRMRMRQDAHGSHLAEQFDLVAVHVARVDHDADIAELRLHPLFDRRRGVHVQ